jgi:hypothetical protein
MTEGYLIVNCSMKNLTQVELMVKSIRLFDKERPISIIAHEDNLKKYLKEICNKITKKIIHQVNQLELLMALMI